MANQRSREHLKPQRIEPDLEFLSRRYLIAVAAGTVLIAATYCLLFLGKSFDKALLAEDGVIQYLGAAGLFAAAIFFFAAFIRAQRAGLGLLMRASLLVLALIFFFGGGEEISWGQRIFGVETPESIREVNEQEEITLHNLKGISEWFPVARLFQAFTAVFAVLVPFLCLVSPRAREWLTRVIPVFPIWLATLFLLSQPVAEAFQAYLNAHPDLYEGGRPLTHYRVEITESVLGVLFAIGALLAYKGVPAKVPARAEALDSRAEPVLPSADDTARIGRS